MGHSHGLKRVKIFNKSILTRRYGQNNIKILIQYISEIFQKY